MVDKKDKKKFSEHFFVKSNLKIFWFSFTVLKLEFVKVIFYFVKMLFFQGGCKTDNGNVFTLCYTIFKRIKLVMPDLSQMKVLSKSFPTVKDFN